MPEDQVNQTGDQGNQTQSLGWRSALPDEFKEHEFVKGFQKPGDFVKSALEIKTERDSLKTEHENLKTKTKDYIPKLPEKATDEEKHVYYMQLGKPEKADDYEFPKPENGEPDAELVKWAKNTFYGAHLNKEQAAFMGKAWNDYVAGRVKAELEIRDKERTEAETKLKTEWGDQYDANVEMVKRVWAKHTESQFDTFVNETKIGNHPMFLRLISKLAKLTGEDKSIHTEPAGFKFPNTFVYPDMKK